MRVRDLIAVVGIVLAFTAVANFKYRHPDQLQWLRRARGAIAIADCPEKGVLRCACPSAPAGTDPCDELPPFYCTKAVTIQNGDFCTRTKADYYVVNGTSSQEQVCYVNRMCRRVPFDPSKCEQITYTLETAIPKIEFKCTASS